MVALGDVTPAQAAAALTETLRPRRHDAGIADAAHALFFLYPRAAGAGRVRTTLDRDLQRFVQAQTQTVVDALSSFHVTDAAVLVVDNRSGDVLAYVGSPDYFSDAALGRNDGVQALRQPGSSLKPFTYELALERGTIRSTSILPDVPATYAIPGGKLYQPADYSGRFSGPVRVRYALANSLNLPAVHVLSDLGVAPLLDRLHELGFAHLTKPPSFYGLGLTLGGGEVTLWELARAYTAVAREGSAIPLRLIDDGTVPVVTHVGDASTWSLVTDMLADPHARERSFGRHSVLDLPFEAAVKTGTSSDFRDTWTVGFTRDYTVAVWVGNFDGSAMRGISGVTGAGPLWNRIMLHLHETKDPEPFAPPSGFVATAICATTGHAPRANCPAIVREWVRPADLADVRRPASPQLGREYDAWIALQPAARTGGALRIVFPHDGDVFVRNPAAVSLQAGEQQIALRAAGGRNAVRWSVDGRPLAPDSEGVAFLPVRLGSWTIVASDGLSTDRVTVRVEPPPLGERPGFTRRP
jgi:penicillin-binding protein 1C